MPLTTNLNLTKSNRINHSTSFVLGGYNCLDTCPKCGQNICEHTSVADVINLPNSVSQDFSTYSSDSSLIKQLFSESTSSTATTTSFNLIPDLQHGQISLNAINQLINISKASKTNLTQNLINCYNLRPLSCQLVLDNETTDKLIKDFFESNKQASNLQQQQQQQLKVEQDVKKSDLDDIVENNINQTSLVKETNLKTKTKKRKFSNFRLFFNKEESSKPSPSRHLLRSSGLVNCLTSSGSSSSSSCEEISKKLTKSQTKKLKKEDHQLTTTTTTNQDLNQNLAQSVVSINSKLTHEVDDENDYNELQTLELCPIVASDIDEEEEDLKNETHKNEIKIIPNNFDLCNYNNSDTNTNTKSFISVKLNNYFYYDYEKKFNQNQENNNNNDNRAKSFTSTITDSSTEITEIHRPVLEYSSSTTATLTRPLIQTNKSTSVSQPSINDSTNNNNNNNNNKTTKFSLVVDTTDPTKKQTTVVKNRLSYFSSCSSCDSNKTSKTTNSSSISYSSTCSSSTEPSHLSPKYHTIAVIFIIIGLFSINLLQETLLLVYYFSTEQFYWFIYSLLALFSGQTLTLILSLLAEIDLVNFSTPKLISFNHNNRRSSATCSSPREPLFNETTSSDTTADSAVVESTTRTTKTKLTQESNYVNELYSVFKNPFSKLCLLIPGFLPISVYIQFFSHVFNYRKSPGHVKFKLEFQLSLYLFFNAMFFSLPLVIINSCFLASTTKLNSISWYYTELFSLFSYYSVSNNPTTSSSASSSITYILNPNNLERKSQFILLLVSIFISISIGICLFITYYELMKQMSFFSLIIATKTTNKQHTINKQQHQQQQQLQTGFNTLNNNNNNNKINSIIDPSLVSLGLVEILVYFCYRFCLITSRLSIIGLFWYLFNEWLFVFVLAHILIGYLSTLFTVKDASTTTQRHMVSDDHLNNKSIKQQHQQENGSTNKLLKKKSKLNQYLTLFIICLLSFIDLFMNQLTELNHLKKVLVYYVVYFVQNVTVLSYWLIKTIINSRLQQERSFDQTKSTVSSLTSTHSSLIVRSTSMSIGGPSSPSSNQHQYSPSTTACYATLIYLCVILFTIFGLILKFLHLHILRKRYRRLCDLRSL